MGVRPSTSLSVKIFKSSVKELVTILDVGRMDEADEASVKGALFERPLSESFMELGGGEGLGTDESTATRLASQLRSAREDGESSGRKESKLRRMTVNPFCSQRAIGESFCPDTEVQKGVQRSIAVTIYRLSSFFIFIATATNGYVYSIVILNTHLPSLLSIVIAGGY